MRLVRRRGFLRSGSYAAKAIGKQLTCVFVDHGLLRKNEKEEVCSVFGPGNANGFDINFICVDARDRYFSKLKGVTEPERKRKIIGEEFIRVFEEEAKKIGKVDFLAQALFTPTWWRAVWAASPPSSRATTMSASARHGGLQGTGRASAQPVQGRGPSGRP